MLDVRDNKRWQDVMQVCLSGHVINDNTISRPEYNKPFCDTCGQKTITKCPECGGDIPGEMHVPGIAVVMTPIAPDFCQKCGKPYPWKENKSAEISAEEDALTWLQELLSRFHTVAKQLRHRHEDRETLDIKDEYDVQDLLHSLLRIRFHDIRPEEWTPSYAGSLLRINNHAFAAE